MDLTQWEKLNPRRGNDETNQMWEREIKDDERMRDAPPPPPRSRTNSVSDGDAAPRETVELCGICMLIEHMMANPPPGATEPQELSAFWATTDAMAGEPMVGTAELHDFLFRLFATTGHTPECSVLSFIVMVAQKNHDDAPLRNVDFATAWGHVLPGERPVSADRINAMEHVLLNALGFDLYVPQDQYAACVAELRGVVRPVWKSTSELGYRRGHGAGRPKLVSTQVTSHGTARPDLAVLLQRHAEFLTTRAAHLPWTTPPQRVSLSTRRRFQ